MHRTKTIVEAIKASYSEIEVKTEKAIEKCLSKINSEGGHVIEFKIERYPIAKEAEKVIFIFIYEFN